MILKISHHYFPTPHSMIGLSNGRTVFTVRYELYLYVWPTTFFLFHRFQAWSFLTGANRNNAGVDNITGFAYTQTQRDTHPNPSEFCVCLRKSKEQSLRTVACLKNRIVISAIYWTEKSSIAPLHTHTHIHTMFVFIIMKTETQFILRCLAVHTQLNQLT